MTSLSLRQLFLQYVAQTSDAPLALEIKKAKGIYLYAPDGTQYTDLIAGIAVSTLGHCHPAVVKAVQKQASRYMHLMVYGEYAYQPQVQLAQTLTQLLQDPFDNVYFVNSGAEAVEGALKLAKRYTQRSELISFQNSYHGSTQGALSMAGNESIKQAYRPLLPDIRHLTYNDFGQLQLITPKTAAVLVEPIQAEAGVILPKEGFLQALRQRCNETQTLLIFDEIQTAFGRTGSLFAFQQYKEVKPDMILLAKGFGAGLPLGAFIAPKSIMHALSHNPVLGHINTFGGNAVSCAASLAMIQTLLKEPKIVQQVSDKEKLFKYLLQHPLIKEVRGKGLLLAVELNGNFALLQKVVKACLMRGLIIDWFLFADNCLRIAPPLIISNRQIKAACSTLLEVLDEV